MKTLPFAYCLQIYNAYQTLKVSGEKPAQTALAQQYGLKSADVVRCIKRVEKGVKRLPKATKEWTGKVTAKMCDDLWAQVVKKRAGYKCEKDRCNKTTNLQAHHIISRQVWSLRHDLENGICLCIGHHFLFPTSAHKDAVGFGKWIATIRDIPYLESKRHNRSKLDYSGIFLYLQNELKK